MENKNLNSLQWISQNQAVEKSLRQIKEAQLEDHPGLLSRWDRVNYIVGGCFRFSRVLYLCGMSGGGKSFILNMLREDFSNPELNGQYPKPFKILSFNFEMDAADEIVRTFSSRLKTNYNVIMSAHNKINNNQYTKLEEESEKVKNDKIFYVQNSGTVEQMDKTVSDFAERFRGNQLIITLDHSLLVDHSNGSDDNILIGQIGKVAMKWKHKFGAMVIILGQMNDQFEKPERINDPGLHFPKKMDIFAGKKVYHAADNVIIIHAPEKIGIQTYGRHGWDTKNLVCWHFIKGRFNGAETVLRMKADFDRGQLICPYV